MKFRGIDAIRVALLIGIAATLYSFLVDVLSAVLWGIGWQPWPYSLYFSISNFSGPYQGGFGWFAVACMVVLFVLTTAFVMTFKDALFSVASAALLSSVVALSYFVYSVIYNPEFNYTAISNILVSTRLQWLDNVDGLAFSTIVLVLSGIYVIRQRRSA